MALASGVDLIVIIQEYQQRLLVRKSVGSNPTLITIFFGVFLVIRRHNKDGGSVFDQLRSIKNDLERFGKI